MNATLVFLLTTITSLISIVASAQDWGAGNTLKYHRSGSHIRLGGGVNKNFPLIPKKTCLLNYKDATDLDTSATNSQAQGAVETSLEIDFIESAEELHKLLGISALMSAQAKFRGMKLPKMSLDGQGSKDSRVSKTSLSFVIKAKSNFGRQMLEDQEFTLKPKYQEMLDAGEFDRFEKYCGSHFVAWQRREGVISAIYTIENLTETEKKQLKLSMEIGNINNGDILDDVLGPSPRLPNDRTQTPSPRIPNPSDPNNPRNEPSFPKIGRRTSTMRTQPQLGRTNGNGGYNRNQGGYQYPPRGNRTKGNGLRVSLDNLLREASKMNKKCTLRFHANGGLGVSGLAQMVSNFSCGADNSQQVNNQLSGLGIYLSSFTFDSAPPVEYNLVEYWDFEPIEEEINHSLLKAVYYRYMDSEAYIVDIIKKLESLPASSRASAEEEYYTKMLDEMDQVRTKLWNMAQSIINHDEFSLEYEYSSIPSLPKVLWNKYSVSIIDSSYKFNCYVKVNDSDTKCGMAKNHYKYFKVPYYWEANFKISATFARADKIKKINVYFNDIGKEKRLISSIQNGYDKERASGYISFVDNELNLTVGKMKMDKNRELYVKYRSNQGNLPEVTLELFTNSGQKIEKKLRNPQLIGAHQLWKRDSSVDYSEFVLPVI